MKYFDMFLHEIKSGHIDLFNNKEFHLLNFAKFCRQYDPKINDLQARKLLRAYEKTGAIKYTEILFFKIIDYQ